MTLRDEFANVKTRREILVARIYDFSAKIASLRLFMVCFLLLHQVIRYCGQIRCRVRLRN